jgi:hypothetical protein
VLAFIAFLVFFILFSVFLDHVLVLSVPFRRFLLLCVEAFCGGFAVYIILFLVFRKVSDRYVARLVEDYYPDELRESLGTAVEVMEEPEKFPYAGRYVALSALKRLEGVEAEAAVSNRAVALSGCALIAAILIFSAYALVSRKSVALSLERLFFPARELAAPTSTFITKVVPGDGEVFEGDDFEVAAEISGRAPDAAFIHYSYDEVNWKQASLGPRKEQTLAGTVRKVQGDFRYYVTAGDAQSETFSVRAIAIPVILAIEKKLTYPSYTKLEPRVEKGGDVEAVVGTEVEVRCRINNRVKAAEIIFPEIARDMRFLDEDTLASTFWVVKDDTYSIRLVDERGQENKPVSYQIAAIEDVPPAISILNLSDESAVISLDSIPATVEASDDYGLDRIALYAYKEGEDPVKNEVVCDDALFKRADFPIDPTKIGVTQGDVFYAYAEARDIRPDANVSRTPTYKFVYYPENWSRLSKDFPDPGELSELMKELSESAEAGEQDTEERPSEEGKSLTAQAEAARYPGEAGSDKEPSPSPEAPQSERDVPSDVAQATEADAAAGSEQPAGDKEILEKAHEVNQEMRRELARDESLIQKMREYLERNLTDMLEEPESDSGTSSGEAGEEEGQRASAEGGVRSEDARGEDVPGEKGEGSGAAAEESEAEHAQARASGGAGGEKSDADSGLDSVARADEGEASSDGTEDAEVDRGVPVPEKSAESGKGEGTASSAGASEAGGPASDASSEAAARAESPGASTGKSGESSAASPGETPSGAGAGREAEADAPTGVGEAAAGAEMRSGTGERSREAGSSSELRETVPFGAGGGGEGGGGYEGLSGAERRVSPEEAGETIDELERALRHLEQVDPRGKVVKEILNRKTELEEDESFLREVDMSRDELLSFARKYEEIFDEFERIAEELSDYEEAKKAEEDPYSSDVVKGRGVDEGIAPSRGIDVDEASRRAATGLESPLEERVSPEYEDLVEEYFEILSKSK